MKYFVAFVVIAAVCFHCFFFCTTVTATSSPSQPRSQHTLVRLLHKAYVSHFYIPSILVFPTSTQKTCLPRMKTMVVIPCCCCPMACVFVVVTQENQAEHLLSRSVAVTTVAKPCLRVTSRSFHQCCCSAVFRSSLLS